MKSNAVARSVYTAELTSNGTSNPLKRGLIGVSRAITISLLSGGVRTLNGAFPLIQHRMSGKS